MSIRLLPLCCNPLIGLARALLAPASLRHVVLLAWLLPLVTACASFGTVTNQPLPEIGPAQRYSVSQALHSRRSGEVTLVLAFSGGGTRAAALSYGVLQALRDTQVVLDGRSRRLLDEIDAISSVSGGSFTAAYFGLFGDRVFADFEDDFLRADISSELVRGLFHPRLWFSSGGRTEMAVDYYESEVFRGASFADLQRRNGPLIAINATDIGRGVRFSFLQDYFDLLCSDLSTFSVARAVAASSAVPVLFHPVVLQNHAGCAPRDYSFVDAALLAASGTSPLTQVVAGLESYGDKERRRYIHLVDGGITDNLGLLAIYEMIEVAGGAKRFLASLGGVAAPRFIIIAVNASTTPQYDMELSNAVPPVEDILNAVTDVQVHRTNATTIELMRNSIRRWSADLSGPGFRVEPYFVELDFAAIAEPARRHYFNQIPTSFTLTDTEADDLVAAGRELLRNNPEFRRFLADLQ